MRRSAAASGRLLREGPADAATSVGLSQTGMHLNNNPQLPMELRVDLPGRERYVVTQ